MKGRNLVIKVLAIIIKITRNDSVEFNMILVRPLSVVFVAVSVLG